jgi:hypothetical protein
MGHTFLAFSFLLFDVNSTISDYKIPQNGRMFSCMFESDYRGHKVYLFNVFMSQ